LPSSVRCEYRPQRFVENTRAHDLNLKSAYLHLLTMLSSHSLWLWSQESSRGKIGVYSIDRIDRHRTFYHQKCVEYPCRDSPYSDRRNTAGIDLHEVAAYIQSFPGVEKRSSPAYLGIVFQSTGFECTLVVQDQLISKEIKLAHSWKQELEHRFGINHPTIQLESSVCGDQGVVVDMHPSLLK